MQVQYGVDRNGSRKRLNMSLLNMLMGNSEHTPKDMFKVVTYVGTGTERSITGVGFKPDFVWLKKRNGATSNYLFDNLRGVTKCLYSDSAGAEGTVAASLTSFDDDGFTLGANVANNQAGLTYVAWCFKADNDAGTTNTEGSITSTVNAGNNFSIVKYTGDGNAGATIGHGLPTKPKLIYIKKTNGVAHWLVYNETIGAEKYMYLSDPLEATTCSSLFNDTEPTDTVFTIGSDVSCNTLNGEYIAYCFADLDGVSKIGSYTGTGAVDNVVPCGFQPAYVMIKRTDSANNWLVFDNKRDTHNPITATLLADSSAAEATATFAVDFTSTGFTLQDTDITFNADGGEYIFLAFAELPTADSPENHNLPLFGQIAYTGDGAAEHNISGLPFKPDLAHIKCRTLAHNHNMYDSLRGVSNALYTDATGAEVQLLLGFTSFNAGGFTLGSRLSSNQSGKTYIAWCWNAGGELVPNTDGSIESSVMANVQGGFSIVKRTGTGANGTFGHGLDSAPEIVIVKSLEAASWIVYHKDLSGGYVVFLDLTNAQTSTPTAFQSTDPTDSVVTLGDYSNTNLATKEYINYCFHSVAGMSKIGSISGTGAEQAITGLGFEPDWVMIKRTDSVDGWHIFDSKREATKYLYADAYITETTTAQTLKSFDSDGFTLGTDAGVNASGGSYIYMAFKAGDNPDTLHQTETGDLQISSESGSIVDDNGTHTITSQSTATVSTVSPACGSYSYDSGAAGWASIPPHSNFNLAGLDWTVDYWEYRTASTVSKAVVVFDTTTLTNLMVGYATSPDVLAYGSSDGTDWNNISSFKMGSLILNTWTHRALVRFGDVLLGYEQGILINQAAITLDIPDCTGGCYIGNWVGHLYPGKLDQLRITKGTALWTTTNFNLTDKGLFYPSGTLNV